MRRFYGVPLLGLVLTIMLLLLAGCGGSDSSSSASGESETSGTASSEGTGSDTDSSGYDPAPFEEILAKGAIPSGFPSIPSTTPKEGAKIGLIDCALELEGCKMSAEAQEEAAERLGQELTVFDTESKPAKTVTAFEQAKQLGIEGLILVSLDPNVTEPLIAEARERGVPVVAQGMAYPKNYNEHPSPTGLNVEQSRAQEELAGEISAAQIVTDTGGKAKILMLEAPEYVTLTVIQEAFERVLKMCSTCEVVDAIQFTGPETTTTLPTQVKAKLTADPDINTVWVASDAFLPGVNPIIEQVGNPDVHSYSLNGQQNSIEIIAEGGVQAGDVAFAEKWLAWAMVDNLNRLLQGEEPITKNVDPFMAVNQENAHEFLNERGSPIDYVTGYEEVWGLK